MSLQASSTRKEIRTRVCRHDRDLLSGVLLESRIVPDHAGQNETADPLLSARHCSSVPSCVAARLVPMKASMWIFLSRSQDPHASAAAHSFPARSDGRLD